MKHNKTLVSHTNWKTSFLYTKLHAFYNFKSFIIGHICQKRNYRLNRFIVHTKIILHSLISVFKPNLYENLFRSSRAPQLTNCILTIHKHHAKDTHTHIYACIFCMYMHIYIYMHSIKLEGQQHAPVEYQNQLKCCTIPADVKKCGVTHCHIIALEHTAYIH